MTDEIVSHFGQARCAIISTFHALLSLLKVYFYEVPKLFRFSDVVMFPAYKGVLLLAPAFWLGKKLYGVKLHYVVIGGWLPDYTRRYSFLRYVLRAYDGIYVETVGRALAVSEFDNMGENGYEHTAVL